MENATVMNERLRHEAELGRRARIAGEFLREFLDERRENIIMKLERGLYRNDDLPDVLADLRVMGAFRNKCEGLIQMGELAEEELRNGD